MNWKQQISGIGQATTPTPTWWLTLWRHVWVLWPLKMFGTMAGIGLFFTAYFWVLRNPTSAPIIMPYTWLDAWIGFQPWTLPIYLSLWLYVGLLPALLKSLPQLLHYLTATIVLSLLGLLIFYYWSTAVPEMPTERMQHSLFSTLNQADESGNACPSLHVAFAVFSAIGFARIFIEVGTPRWIHYFNAFWCAAICYSTIATCQHVALDTAAGLVLGSAIGGLFCWLPRKPFSFF